ncbi:MAG: MCP four helix bundle domain-containing protein [Burkholderiales bacterium]
MFRGLKSGSIARRMSMGLALALLLAAGATWIALTGLTSLQGNATQVHQRIVPALKTVLGVMADVRQSRLLETQLLVARGDEARRQLETQIEVQRGSLRQHLQRYTSLDDLDRRHAEQVTGALLGYWAAQDQVLAAARRAVEGTTPADTPYQLAQGVSLSAYDAANAAIDGWRLHGEQVAEASSQGAAGDPGLRTGLVVLLLAAALLVGAVTIGSTRRAIHQPLAQAMTALRAVARGDASYRLKITSLDEMGRLLVAIDDLRETLSLAFSEEDGDEPHDLVEVLSLHNRSPQPAHRVSTTAGKAADNGPRPMVTRPSHA